MAYLRSMDVGRTQCYDIKALLLYEVTGTFFFLSEITYLLPASNKSGLQMNTKKLHFPYKKTKAK